MTHVSHQMLCHLFLGQDKNGTIEYNEFVEALNTLGAKSSENHSDEQLVKEIFEESDFDSNSGLDFKEFTVNFTSFSIQIGKPLLALHFC